MANFKHISHKKSKLIREVLPEEFYGLTPTADNSDAEGSSPVKLNLAKRPTAEKLIEGEIAVNYLKGHETLTIKNDEDEIVGFVNENEFNEAQEIVALGLAEEKNERIASVANVEEKLNNINGDTDELKADIEEINDTIDTLATKTELEEVTDAIEDINNRIEDNELVTSSALNDLNSRIESIGGVTEEEIEDINDAIDQINQTINGLADIATSGLASDAAATPITASSTTVAVTGNNAAAQIASLGQTLKTVQDNASKYKMVALTQAEIEALSDVNVKEAYKVVSFQGEETAQTVYTQVGDIVKIYKDSSLIDSYLGSSSDTVNSSTGVITKYVYELITDPTTKITAAEYDALTSEQKALYQLIDSQSLNFVYERADGSYEIVKIDVSKFLAESEFGSGLQVDNNGVVSVKIDSTSDDFITVGSDGIKISGVQDAIDEINEAIEGIGGTIEDNELVVSSALNDLNSRIESIGGVTEEEIEDINDAIGQINQTINGLADIATSGSASDASATPITASTTTVAVTGNNAAAQIASLAETLKTVQDNASKYKLHKLTTAEVEALHDVNVKDAYNVLSFQGEETAQTAYTPVGDTIKIYKDSSLKEVYLGASTDTIDTSTGVITKNTVTDPQSLNFAYQLADGTYSLVKIDVSAFLRESEFGDGLQVSNNGVVSLKIDNTSDDFITVGADGLKISGIQDAIEDITTDIENIDLIVSSALTDIDARVRTNYNTIATLLQQINDLTARVETLENNT